MKILVINAGSSSLKFQLIDMDDESVKAKGLVERIGIEGTHFKQTVLGTDKVIEFTRNMKDHTEAISAVLSALTDKDNGAIASLDEIGACGHRVLHGGETFKNSVLVTEETIKGIEDLVPLGPLHQPANIAGIKACQAVMPTKPNVAVFDTAFHQTMPKKAFLYGVPYEYYKDLKVRRYGFHGTSHRFIAGETPKYLGKKPEDCKFIICHLGNGSSLSAIVGGKVVDTSMGLTPLEGVLMGTRSGDVDPAVLEYIMDNTGMDIHQMLNCLNKKSGFAGLSCSSDMRDVKAAAEKGDEQASDFLTFFNIDEKGFDFVFDLNIKGVLLPSQVFMADMIGRKGCSVLNISSMNAYRPLTKIPAYSAAKAAVTNFTEWLAVHFAKENIRVNAIAPGFFVTNQNRALLFNEDGTATPRTDKILRSTPMGRFGEAEELLGAVEWLLDESKAGFVTGVTIPIDGGFSAYSGV